MFQNIFYILFYDLGILNCLPVKCLFLLTIVSQNIYMMHLKLVDCFQILLKNLMHFYNKYKFPVCIITMQWKNGDLVKSEHMVTREILVKHGWNNLYTSKLNTLKINCCFFKKMVYSSPLGMAEFYTEECRTCFYWAHQWRKVINFKAFGQVVILYLIPLGDNTFTICSRKTRGETILIKQFSSREALLRKYFSS